MIPWKNVQGLEPIPEICCHRSSCTIIYSLVVKSVLVIDSGIGKY